MKKLSLCFKSDLLEQRYQEETRLIYNKIFVNILIAYIFIIGIPCVIIASVSWNISDLIVYSVATSTCIFYYTITTRLPKYFNLWVNSLNLFASFAMGGQIFLFGPTIGIDDRYVLFFFGAAGFSLHITVAFLSANFLMTFGQIVSSAFLYYSICWSTQLYAYKYAYGAFTLFIIHFFYNVQKNRREIFLLRDYEKEWAQIVKKGLSQSIITVKYNKKNNYISLDMINDQARKLLSLNNSNEFKLFSRKTLVFDSFKDYEDDGSIYKSDQRSQFLQAGAYKLDDKSKNTLENRIISILKQSITNKMKFTGQNQSPNASKKMTKNIQLQLEMQIENYYDTQQFGTEFNSQVEDLFYGIFKKSEDSIEKRISIKASTYQNQADFFCCLVIEEETNKQKVKILEGINKNFEKNFFQFCLYVATTPLRINSPSKICSRSQIHFNSIKPTDGTKQELDARDIFLSQEDQRFCKEIKEENNNCQKYEDEDFQHNKLDPSQHEIQSQTNHINSKEVNVKFEMIQGECDLSNILKISVTDYGRGMPLHKMLKLLEIIGSKNPAYNSEYQNYNFLGWKINHHIIGNVGPFYNFYIKNLEHQGFEYHFYIFQNIDILANPSLQKSKTFQNSLFQEFIVKSNQNYYHINNLDLLREKIRKTSYENQFVNKSNNALLQQSIKQSIINHNNNHKYNEYYKQVSSAIQSSLNESLSLSQDFTSQIIIPPKNLTYQMVTKFIASKSPCSDSFQTKSAEENSN